MQRFFSPPTLNIPIVVLVSGSREWKNNSMIERDLDQVSKEYPDHLKVLVHGGCKSGADSMADAFILKKMKQQISDNINNNFQFKTYPEVIQNYNTLFPPAVITHFEITKQSCCSEDNDNNETNTSTTVSDDAKRGGWKIVRYDANWDDLSRAAGPIRNKFMVNHSRPHVALLYCKDSSPGTENTKKELSTYKDGAKSRLIVMRTRTSDAEEDNNDDE